MCVYLDAMTQTFCQGSQFVFIAFTAVMLIKAVKYCFVRSSSVQSYIPKY